MLMKHNFFLREIFRRNLNGAISANDFFLIERDQNLSEFVEICKRSKYLLVEFYRCIFKTLSNT